ncbi:phosphatidylinositol-4,5-bisphosphate 3-kinase catalytic subunit delta isoform, putative [Entamoeba invadens IP1]|uniref:phosphatidylinositol 3-kinase n=1 Tax=Entamoeba invadens IP1 TaxID=370355 RepID=A0A0A1U2Z4_ENTIV|nr:phosphatidylinositol-4,5-bisphosphate 3-kinase catalytic subunit delta isoform, putative [Entamoeba invadens IP1]ELP88436.1 phosphatidylinositol-4,5-bisphosphate 3-kinase catalytic subunit delta isoform, putative [Entamoeba invadens IP1]|eukprot:XP_004255207.1 phosphatidylinositol-4,5-bisphosphate 3-kinase catalytic subunit delta isoform, putative [Entamoeba invadens IP1]
MSMRKTRTTFSVPRKTQVVDIDDSHKVRVIVKNGEKWIGLTFSPAGTTQMIIESIKAQHLVPENEAFTFCLFNLPFYFNPEDPVAGGQIWKFCLAYGYRIVTTILPTKSTEKFLHVSKFLEFLESTKINFFIIGKEYTAMLATMPDESRDFRASLARVIQEEVEWSENHSDKRTIEENEYVYVESEPPIPNKMQKVKINGRYGNDLSMKTIAQSLSDTVCTVINSLYTKLFTMKPTLFDEGSTANDFVLKVRGSNEFLVPKKNDGSEYTLCDFDYIRRCVAHNEPIDIVLYKRSKMYQYLYDPEKLKMSKYFHMFVGNNYWGKTEKISLFLSQRGAMINFGIQIMGCGKLKMKPNDQRFLSRIYFIASLHYGTRILSKPECSEVIEVIDGFVQISTPITILFDMLLSTLPKETRLIISVYYTEAQLGSKGGENREHDICLSTVNCKLVDYNGYFMKGTFNVGMWENINPNPYAMCCENSTGRCKLIYRMIEFDKPVKMDTFIATKEELRRTLQQTNKLLPEHKDMYKAAVEADPLVSLTEEEIRLLWIYRGLVMNTKPRALARLVSAVDFTKQDEVIELHRLLERWPLLEPTPALELLDFRFPDEKVRLFALKCIDAMKDHELVDFLPQLVQALKFEIHHQSFLAFFLLRRALRNKNIIGHQFFWFLKAEMHDNRVAERYGVLLESFLNGIEGYKTELYNEVNFQNELVVIANEVKNIADREEQKEYLRNGLVKLKYPEEMSLPLDSRFRVKKPVKNCGNVFSSKKKPLMLVLENVDPIGNNITVIQKVGDDLRQDVLTLQMLQLMNNIWKSAGLDLRMLPYRCIATGDETGMLELVQDSETYGKIIADNEGTFRVFKEDLLTKWLKEQCSRPESKVTFDQAVENFVYSCAGYCVATYILGIGDRHSDNVMIRKDGKFFHIDFGHFLGNFKSKFGVKRERTPFKFTGHFAHVMGGRGAPNFKLFEDLCLRAFACIRKQGSLFIYLFRLMLATGIPELQSEKDIEYMRNMFMFDKKEDEAREEFRQLIYKCLDAKSQTFNDLVHDYMHYK